ncbi:isopentenyl diphosphate isomerase/L-lactate dehydrogenase-like FMN-dependent dehydrogenase [Paenibacillus anaericanus]|uniref:STAS/SEC14 domain-containing protein n=1 Tax=Paenibacillus anaericanus TaxID=170367 RepID=A0A433YC06_9BACL|nr:hypothetical protein [Paenibacillus anaericanus]MDQ0088853.1 isopentenyl diphosphate isomerase/L-lactate dehydrogenase-like FMN-dependent dehydrogenase [Paenibacillus anaericanus]RUT47383.1 hypothetical protein EJP82_06635 [Paenibacillus anaericanus]
MMTTFFTTDSATVSWNEKAKAVHVEFNTFVHSNELREICDKAMELQQQKGAQRMISDNRKLTVISQEDQEWISTVHNQRIQDSGIKFVAIVLPEKTIGKISMKRVVASSVAFDDIKTAFESFDTVEGAEEWLNS